MLLAFSSGQAATAALLALLEPGAAVMYPDDSYTGTQALLGELEQAGQVRPTAVDVTDTERDPRRARGHRPPVAGVAHQPDARNRRAPSGAGRRA